MNELSELADNVDPRAELPRRFDLYSKTMQILWLRQHQKRNEHGQPKEASHSLDVPSAD
jgi:hypothetical protein